LTATVMGAGMFVGEGLMESGGVQPRRS
jgi:hypothetical protein